jgi:hypothetical protein
MRAWIRTGIAAAAGACTLAFAGSALAAVDPTLVITNGAAPGAGPAVSVTANLKTSDAPLAKLQLYPPIGYQLNAPKVGMKVGDVAATARAADENGAAVALRGTITAVDPSTFGVESARCDDVGHDAAWSMNLAGGGQSLKVPMSVDRTSGAEADLSVYKIVVCLPPPDVAAGTAGRAPLGMRFVSLRFDLGAFANPPASGDYRWRSLWTPYAAGTGKADTAASVEAQAIVRLPTQVTIEATKVKVRRNGKLRTLVAITGRLSQDGKPFPAAKVSVQDGKTQHSLYRLKAVFTKKDGTYVKKLYITKPSWFMTEISMPLRTLGSAGCQASFGPDVRCVSAVMGGNHVWSDLVRVTPFRR